MIRHGLLLSLAVLSVAVLMEGMASAADRTSMVGKIAPGFTIKDQDGRSHTLQRHHGKIVVLEWTNPTCPFVRRHYKNRTMVKTVVRFGNNVVWLAIDSSFYTTPEASRAFRTGSSLPYSVLQDPRGDVGRSYAARTTPHMFVIDRSGVIRYDGAIDDDPHDEKKTPHNHVSAAIEALLAGKAPGTTETDPYGCSVKYRK